MRIRAPRRQWYRSYLPGWWVFNPGSGGGAATVQTDGVTIQGDGSGGNKIALKAVQTDGTLTGAGTVASTLRVKPLTIYFNSSDRSNGVSPNTNQVTAWAHVLQVPVTFSNLTIYIVVADAVNNADVGVYNAAGNLVANAGAQVMAATTWQTFAMVQGSQTILPGLYYFAFTSNSNTISFGRSLVSSIWAFTQNANASAGGALPATITPPAFAPSNQDLPFGLS